jgi:hypothetical protein
MAVHPSYIPVINKHHDIKAYERGEVQLHASCTSAMNGGDYISFMPQPL